MRTTVLDLARLRAALESNPNREHLRLGQMIVNACGRDPYYVENDELLRALEDATRVAQGKREGM